MMPEMNPKKHELMVEVDKIIHTTIIQSELEYTKCWPIVINQINWACTSISRISFEIAKKDI